MEPAASAIEAVLRRSLPGAVTALGVDVHFQPDAITSDGVSVIAAIASTGRWATQFETGTSNGGATAFVGGDRWSWESRLFAGAYDDARPGDRPAYGALRTTEDPYGSAPRFGSAHLRLRADVLARTTLCFPDSVFEPTALGTAERAGAVLAAVEGAELEDPLDRYVEAHVHGGIELRRDVAAIVLDPSFRGTPIEDAAVASAVPVAWHPGYELTSVRIPALAPYRGQHVAEAATRVAAGGPLTPASLGRARRDGALDAQLAKRVWHLLAAHGRIA